MTYQVMLRVCLCGLLAAGRVQPVSAQQGQPQRQVPSGPWSLEQCITYAVENNLQIRQSLLNSRQSQLNLNRNRAAQLPSLNANASHNYNFGRSVDPFTNQFTTEAIRANNFSVSSSVNLFSGFQTRNSIKQSQQEQQAAELDVQTMRNDITLQVVTAYLQMLFSDELIQTATLVQNNTREQLERSQKLYKAGSLAESSVIELQAQVASDELSVITAQNNRDLARLTLMQLLNIQGSERFDIVKPDIPEPSQNPITPSAEQIYGIAEQTQPQVKSAEIRVQSAITGLKVAKGGYYPSLNLSGNVFTGYSSARSLFVIDNSSFETVPIGYTGDPTNPANIVYTTRPRTLSQTYVFGDQLSDNLSKSVGLSLRIPILNGFQVRNNINRAELTKQNAELSADITRNQLRQSIERAYTDARAAEKKYLSAQRQLSAFQQAFNNAQLRLDKGAINSTDFNVAKNNFTRAQSDLIQAKYDYVFKLKVLDFYQGKPLTL